MSFFPRAFATEFAPVFSLLDDYASAASTRGGRDFLVPACTQRQQRVQSFQPKFDVRENQDSYELHGELPGLDQEHLSVEFTDSDTIAIRGRTESVREQGTPPAAPIEAQEPTEQIESDNASKQATVEDEDAETDNDTAVHTPAESSKEVEEPQKPQSRYWVSERSVGSFSRSFSFPQHVDQDAVTASLKNGILSIVVPKAANKGTKRIEVQ
ncbi:hypothetical protein B0A48_03304 [Cryoendolithus antarcticus]|uniref:SHSP domain-containing protein n=1 Tax=Cryoendolithus antarcticus TaxID=1507870 RepID=A0A1V8TJM9_9PEZI|nr:hypothetical protein B0A48_03304 [Cryoendolithus antarcticus]